LSKFISNCESRITIKSGMAPSEKLKGKS